MKTLHIYFHKDFDGIVSAAILKRVLSKKNLYDGFKLYPVDYNIMDNWLNEPLRKPSAVLDFLYHPDADYYYDHHTTSFLTEDIKNSYVNDRHHFWDPNFKSTPSLLKYKLQDMFDFQEYSTLLYWSDVIDSAEYPSPQTVYDNTEKYILFNKLISCFYKNNDFFIESANQLIEYGVDFLLDKFESDLKKLLEEESHNLLLLKDKIKVENNICIFDQSDYAIQYQRYLPYYYYPDIDFTIGIYRKDKYSISIGYNPWKNSSNIDLGSLAKSYGGGGRKNVAGILTNSKIEANQIVESIHLKLKALN